MVGRIIKIKFLCFFIILLFSGLAFGEHMVLIGGTATYFEYRRTITIQSGQVIGTQTFFPMLFDSTKVNSGLRDDLKLWPTGKVKKSNGDDIVFATGYGIEILKHEIEKYDNSTGDYIAWVRVESISDGTVFYLYYGSDDSIAYPANFTTDVWDSNYVGVWHLKESGSGAVDEYGDSTQYTNHGQGGLGDSNYCPTRISDGQIGYAQSFSITPDSNGSGDDEGDLIDVGDTNNDPELDIHEDQITLEAWVRHNITPDFGYQYGILNHKGYNTSDGGYRIIFPDNTIKVCFQLPGQTHSLTSNNTVGTGAWHHIVAVYDGAIDKMMIYIDGSKDTNELTKLDNIISVTGLEDSVWIGHGDQPWDKAWSYPWDGDLDEVRISDSARTGDWIKTEHNNQNQSAPGSFYSISGPTLVELSYFRAKGLNSAVLLEWATETELDNEGFNIWRSEEKDGRYKRINPYFVPAEGEAGLGAEYSFIDYDVQNGKVYYYKLEDIDIYGHSTFHGPVSVIPNDIIIIWPPDRIFLPSDAFLFSWSSRGSYSFKIEISPSPSFPASETFSYPDEEWISGNSLWLRPDEWEMVLRKSHESGGQLFWRVRARSEDGRAICSDWKRFFIHF